MTTIDNDNLAKTNEQFCCEYCNYTTNRKYNLSLHLDSIKHKNNIINNKNNSSLAKKTYNCENCSKNFNDRAGLWRHKKTCSFNGVEQAKQPSVQSNHHVEKTDETTDKQLLMMLIKENSELIDIIKNGHKI